jgi:hypothetical protein
MNIELPLDGKQRARLRPISKTLFHSEYALEAFLLIAKEARFFKGQVAEAAGCQPNYAAAFLKRLEGEQFIERLPTEAGQRRHYFCKVPSPVWTALVQLTEALLQEPVERDAQVTRLPKRSGA